MPAAPESFRKWPVAAGRGARPFMVGVVGDPDPARASELPESRYGLSVIERLSVGIGPRPPGSAAETEAAGYVARELEKLDLIPEVETFRSGRSFGPTYLMVFGLALAGSLLQRLPGFRSAGHALAGLGAYTAIQEGRFSRRGPAWLLRRRESRNVFATIEPEADASRTVCLVSHLDSSRSGLMFHPRVTPRLGTLIRAVGGAVLLQVVAGPLERIRWLRSAVWASRLLSFLAFTLVAEREIRGEDVPGANDNASGVGACLALARSLERTPLETTRVVILITGSEESGPLGIRDFLSRHDTDGWIFLNFDGVGADAPLRVLVREAGGLAPVNADPGLLAHAAAIGAVNPELAAPPLDLGSGLPYDATPVLAAGGRAISVVNQGEGAIPDYHWPTDRMDRISAETFDLALRFGRALLERIDRG